MEGMGKNPNWLENGGGPYPGLGSATQFICGKEKSPIDLRLEDVAVPITVVLN